MRRIDTALKHRWLKPGLVAALVASFVTEAGAAPAGPELPTDPVLAGLIEQSLAARPEVAQAAAEAKAERERIPQAGALPDPTLQLGIQNDGFTWMVGKMESSYVSVMASQTFPWPGKRQLRSEVAGLGADKVEQGVTRARLSTETQVRSAYLALVLARDRLALLDKLEELWRKSAAVARSRYETGQGAQSDLLRAQLGLNRIGQRRWEMRAELATQTQALNRLRGHPLDEPIEPAVHLAQLPPPALREVEELTRDALERSPELAAARLGEALSQKSVALARKAVLPDLTVSAGLMPRGGDFPPMWSANVAIPVPIFSGSKQRRAVAENEARGLASQKSADAVEQLLRLRVQQRRTALEVALETIRLYQDGLLVQSQATADSTLAQYQVGKVTFASVLEANAGLVADQDGYLQALARAHQLEIERAEVSLAQVAGTSAGMSDEATSMPGAKASVSMPSPSSAAAAVPTDGGSGSTSMSGM